MFRFRAALAASASVWASIVAGAAFSLSSAPASADTIPERLQVEKRDFVRTLTLTGEIQAAESVTITSPAVSSKWNYTITRLIAEGTEVEAGAILATFDASDLELRRLDLEKSREEARLKIAQKETDIESRRQDLLLQRAQAERDMKVAELSVDINPDLIARSELERYRFDFETGRIALQRAQERLESLERSAQAELEVVRLEFEQADLELKRILADLSRMQVRAPSRGIVLYEENWSTGRKIQAGDQIHKRQRFLRIPNLDRLIVKTVVHHSDVSSLKLGQEVRVVIDAYPERAYRGRIASLPEIAKSKSSRTQFKFFQIKVTLEEMDRELMKPGMTARVRLDLRIPDTLQVPRRALHTDAQGKSYLVTSGENPRRIDVDVLDLSDRWAAVQGDLQAEVLLKGPGDRADDAGTGEVEWIPIEVRKLDFHVSGNGLLRSRKSAFIRPPSLPNAWNFKIARMAPEGIDVQEGDFIVQFDPQDFLKRLRDEQSNLAKVRKELEKIESSFALELKDLELAVEEAKVAKEKADNKLIQAREFESLREVKTAQYEAEYAALNLDVNEKKLQAKHKSQDLQLRTLRDKEEFYRARVRANQGALARLTITAPISGVLVYQTNWNNEKKKVGDQVYMNESIFGIPDLSTLRVEGRIGEVDAGKVAVGQSVKVSLDALPDETFSGRVQEVGTIFKRASFNQPAKVLDVIVELDSVDEKRMRPGTAARLQIEVESFRDVIAVPLSVIQVEGESSFVWVKDGEGAAKRRVEVGKDNGIVAIIREGLEEGDQVAARPLTSVVGLE